MRTRDYGQRELVQWSFVRERARRIARRMYKIAVRNQLESGPHLAAFDAGVFEHFGDHYLSLHIHWTSWVSV